jgi:hypothetical protein
VNEKAAISRVRMVSLRTPNMKRESLERTCLRPMRELVSVP